MANTPAVSAQRLDQYRRELKDTADAASEWVQSAINSYAEIYPNATVAETREYVINLIKQSNLLYGRQSAYLAKEFFDELAVQAGVDIRAELMDTIGDEYVESKIRYYAKDLVNQQPAKFNSNVTALSAYYVKRNAMENMTKNCEKNKVRFARVPTGHETCGFCYMLASRGFVYHSEALAGGGAVGNHYHQHCDCVIVPSFTARNIDDNEIEGYTPSVLYDVYKDLYEAVKGDPKYTTRWFCDLLASLDDEALWGEYRKHM